MRRRHTEERFEEAFEAGLLAAGWTLGDRAAYDGEAHLFPADATAFIRATQPHVVAKVEALHGAGAPADAALARDLVRERASKGTLHVLRHGFKSVGRTVRVCAFKPNTSFNEKARTDFDANRLTVTRQISFRSARPVGERPARPVVDVVLAVNGLPIVTAELKNPMTSSKVQEGMGQYRLRRAPEDGLFMFKSGALVHLAIDPDEVWMTTRLDDRDTVFLPFNRGNGGRAGNPPNPAGHAVAYLWEEVFTPRSLLEIVQRFVHLEVTKKRVAVPGGRSRTITKERLVFPRYHQLDVVRRLAEHAHKNGPGHSYLIEHSAGSGKSNSIAWLAHRLSGLHDEDDRKVFDGVVVVTDRRVLDKQLQDTIYQIEHKRGVVEKIDEDTQQLVRALSDGTPIIITTIQKFPYVTEVIDRLADRGEEASLDTAGKRYAVIVDEAHSGQSGEAAQELKRVLNRGGIAAAVAGQLLDEDDEIEAAATEAAEARRRQDNLSFFAFTATPKYKTYHAFDEPGPDGRAPFHLYPMRQAIEEGFILDVLQSYTTYRRYYALTKAAEDDPFVKRRAAAKRLARFVELHPYNVGQVTEIIVEHFREHVRHEMGGRAKAMVVTGSRLAAVRYKRSFDDYIKRNRYEGELKTLVAFSGSVEDPEVPGVSYTEPGMNDGLSEKALPEAFEGNDYRVLIVADKYQTGFDEPALQAMYVVRKLTGVKVVQTLSRLNRIAPGKKRTFVLDFANDPADVQREFSRFHQGVTVEDAPEPQVLYDLHHELMNAGPITETAIEALAEIIFRTNTATYRDHAAMSAILRPVEDACKELEETERTDFRTGLARFQSLYAFLSQIIPFADSELERFHAFARYLLPRLHEANDEEIEAGGDVELRYFRAQLHSSSSLAMDDVDAPPLRGFGEGAAPGYGDDEVRLGELVDAFNDRFGTDFTRADQLFFDQVEETAVADETVMAAAEANGPVDFKRFLADALPNLFFDRMDGNEEVSARVLADKELLSVAADVLARRIYDRLQAEHPAIDGNASSAHR